MLERTRFVGLRFRAFVGEMALGWQGGGIGGWLQGKNTFCGTDIFISLLVVSIIYVVCGG